jgi:AcrR family transcriptional regulator
MARTQAADYEERREAIVDHAARLFAKSGFLGASIIDLANACQTSKSLIYHYYPSKEDILYAVMSSHLDQLAQDMAEVQTMAGGPEARLSALVHRFMAHYVGAADRQKVLLNDLDNLPPDKRYEIVRKQRRIIDYVRDLLVQITPDLDKAKGQAQVQTMLLFGMINWTHTWFDPNGPVSASEVADMAIQLVMPSGAD